MTLYRSDVFWTCMFSFRTLLTHLSITKTTTITQSCAGSSTLTHLHPLVQPLVTFRSHFNNSWQHCDAFERVIKCSSRTWLALQTHPHSLARGIEDMMAPILGPSNVQLGMRITLCAEARRHPSIYSPLRVKISGSRSAGTIVHDCNIAFQSRHLFTDLCLRWCIELSLHYLLSMGCKEGCLVTPSEGLASSAWDLIKPIRWQI